MRQEHSFTAIGHLPAIYTVRKEILLSWVEIINSTKYGMYEPALSLPF